MIPAEALRLVPGCAAGEAPRAIALLSDRGASRVVRVDSDTGQFVLRVSAMPDAWLASDRTVEAALHARAADAGLAPDLVAADPVRGWFVTPFVPGAHWTPEQFGEQVALVRLGETLAQLHAIPPLPAARRDVGATLDAYVTRLHGGTPRDVAAVDRAERRLSAARAALLRLERDRRPTAFCHHDLHGGNVLETSRGIVLLDFECAAVVDPIFDAACIRAYHEVAAPRMRALLVAMALQDVDEGKLDDARLVFDVHTWLWYRERRARLFPTAAERRAEQVLDRALERRLARMPRA